MKENLIVEVSYAFALRVIALAKDLREKREFDLASQFWRAGTSICANIEEAQAAQSRADFQSKMSIAAKEARETRYWLRLSRDGKILPSSQIESALEDIERILRILTSIVKTTSESQPSKIAPVKKLGGAMSSDSIQNPKSKISSPS